MLYGEIDTGAMRDMAMRAACSTPHGRVPDVHMNPTTLREIADEIDYLRRARDSWEQMYHARSRWIDVTSRWYVVGIVIAFTLGAVFF